MKLRTGVIGTGALGRHHVRILSELGESEVVGIFDRDPAVAEALGREHGVEVAPAEEWLLERADAVVIAAPTVDHAEIACRALSAGCHVLVEKPIAPDLEAADRILAAAGDRVVAVGHVEFYNPAVQCLLDHVGRAGFVEIERLSRFTARSLDIDVLLDLMIHDLQIVQALDPTPVEEVRGVGVEVLSDRVDIASARLELGSGAVVNVTASRVSDQRVRRLRVFAEDAYYSLDYQEQTIKGFRLESSSGQRAILPADLVVPKREPLREELRCFLDRCRGENGPMVDGRAGRAALALALRVREAVGRRRVAVGGGTS